jgi:hypothetical protein
VAKELGTVQSVVSRAAARHRKRLALDAPADVVLDSVETYRRLVGKEWRKLDDLDPDVGGRAAVRIIQLRKELEALEGPARAAQEVHHTGTPSVLTLSGSEVAFERAQKRLHEPNYDPATLTDEVRKVSALPPADDDDIVEAELVDAEGVPDPRRAAYDFKVVPDDED